MCCVQLDASVLKPSYFDSGNARYLGDRQFLEMHRCGHLRAAASFRYIPSRVDSTRSERDYG